MSDGDGDGDGVVCAADINNFVLEYNSFLEQRIVRLSKKLSDAQLIFCDVYRPMMEIINNPNTYGMIQTMFLYLQKTAPCKISKFLWNDNQNIFSYENSQNNDFDPK